MKKNEPLKRIILDQLRKTPIIETACQKAGVARMTFYRWKKDKRFAEDVEQALLEGQLLVNDLAESQLISAIKDKNMSAIMNWLRHHHPAYANKLELNAHIKETHELSSEQQNLIETALRMAKLPNLAPESPATNDTHHEAPEEK